MKCVYLKKTENEYRGTESNPRLASTSEYFQNCVEEKCPAYDSLNNKCRKLEKELNNETNNA